MAEVEPQAGLAGKGADDRAHVGQAGAPAEPRLGLLRRADRKQLAGERFEPVDMGGRRRIVGPGEFGPGGETQPLRHRRDQIALLDVEHRSAQGRVAPWFVMPVVAALDEERQLEAERPDEIVRPGPKRDHDLRRRDATLVGRNHPASPAGSSVIASPFSNRPPR